ncbi:unnamed protein product [marine sediment metagenome]|uniref:Uncharacterized protein n=1 Tax=marine sediment metagenome TaxID=412755 RepID=X1SB82_9ZZZZ
MLTAFIVLCEKCARAETYYHPFWCSCMCQNCGTKIDNPLHNCKGKTECYYGEDEE